MDPKASNQSVRDRLMQAGVELFSEKGFDAASVREICDRASASSRMIHHYFGSKQGLFDAILEQFSQAFLDAPLRIIAEPVDNPVAFASRFELFLSETLFALMQNRGIFDIVVREQIAMPAFTRYYDQLHRFLSQAQDSGLLRKELDLDLLTGIVLDRVGNQVTYADAMTTLAGRNVFTDDDYRRAWVRANADLLLNGFLKH